jgi:hypothetical protein
VHIHRAAEQLAYLFVRDVDISKRIVVRGCHTATYFRREDLGPRICPSAYYRHWWPVQSRARVKGVGARLDWSLTRVRDPTYAQAPDRIEQRRVRHADISTPGGEGYDHHETFTDARER